MKSKLIRFSSLVYINKPPKEIFKILSNTLNISLIKSDHKNEISYEIIGPFKSFNEDNFENISSKLKKRSIELKIDRDDLIGNAAESIYRAQLAEKKINEGAIHLIFRINKKATEIRFILDVISVNATKNPHKMSQSRVTLSPKKKKEEVLWVRGNLIKNRSWLY